MKNYENLFQNESLNPIINNNTDYTILNIENLIKNHNIIFKFIQKLLLYYA